MEKGLKKILFYLPNLHHGGAEGVMVDVANYLVEHGFDVAFALVKAEGVLLDQLDSRINVIDLNMRKQWFAFLKLPFVVRAQKPDYVFSTMKESNFIAILSRMLAFSKAKNIIREASTVTQQIANESKWYQKIKNKIIFHFYRYADHVVALSEAMKKDLQTVVPSLKDERITVIPNPVNIEKIETLAKEPIDQAELDLIKNRPLLLSVGRLYESKNYGFLFDALAEYRKQGNEFTFFALGEGPLRQELEDQIKRLGLDDCCYLLGYRANPFKYMKQADVFLLPSLYEGMSNSLIQACALGLPTVVMSRQSTSVEVQSAFGYKCVFENNNVISFVNSLTEIKNFDLGGRTSDYFKHEIIVDSYRKVCLGL